MKKLVSVLLMLALAAALVVPVMAQQADLVDHAGLLTPKQFAAVKAAVTQAAQELQVDVVIVTVDSLNGKSSQRYAEDYYDSHGYADAGVLLLVCMAEREYWVCTTGTAVDLEELENRFVPLLSSGDYTDALIAFAQALPEYLYEDVIGDFGAMLIICLVIGLVAALITTLAMKAQLRSVRPRYEANSYVVQGSFRLDHSRDIYLFRNVTRTPKPKNNSSSSSGGSRSHGGGGGKF